MSNLNIVVKCIECEEASIVELFDSNVMVEREGNKMHPVCGKCLSMIYSNYKRSEKKIDTFDGYQNAANDTAIYPGQMTEMGILYTVLGLCGEVGEVAEIALNASIGVHDFDKWMGSMNSEQVSLSIVSKACRIAAILSKAIRDSGGKMSDSQCSEIDSLFYAISGIISDYNRFHLDVIDGNLEGNGMNLIDRNEMQKEFGDCLWFGAQLMKEFGIEMSSAARNNIDKLASRKKRGVIGGEGGDR